MRDPTDFEPPTLRFSSDTERVREGDSFRLNWSTQNADSCVASGDWQGERPTEGDTTLSAGMSGERRFTLRCFSATGVEAARTLSVEVVAPPPTLTRFELLDPEAPLSAGDRYRVRYRGSQLDRCTISNTGGASRSREGDSGEVALSVPASGSGELVTTIRCIGRDGTEVSEQLTASVQARMEGGGEGAGSLSLGAFLLLLAGLRARRIAAMHR